MEHSEIKLTEREILIANLAADLAVKKMTENFYTEVGRSIMSKFFIILGAAAVAFVLGKGWITWRN